MSKPEVEKLRRKAVAAKALLSRRYNEMENCRRGSTKTFAEYVESVEAYNAQAEAFHAAVQAWKEAHNAV